MVTLLNYNWKDFNLSPGNHGNRLIFIFPYSIFKNVEKLGLVLFHFSFTCVLKHISSSLFFKSKNTYNLIC